ncbi:MAG: hypothetical protein OES32_06890 [Acidobacteriota bacterium]|nr:hypothetical protein [Acidobacteriota bacterium]MDH3523297.1 hypothetical protein [Acidobacteriota bacterium]
MRRRWKKSARGVLLLGIALLVLPGCDTSPTGLEGGTQVFQGTVAVGGRSSHDFTVTSAGGIRVEVESLVADPPLPEGITPSLGFGLGQRAENGDCAATFRTSIREGTNLAFGLQEGAYCIVLADNGTLEEESTRTYSVLVRISE